jgi:hypothetical protein
MSDLIVTLKTGSADPFETNDCPDRNQPKDITNFLTEIKVGS